MISLLLTWSGHDKKIPEEIPGGVIARSTDQAHGHLSEDVLGISERVLLNPEPAGGEGVDCKHRGEIPGLELCSFCLDVLQVLPHLLPALHHVRGHHLELARGEDPAHHRPGSLPSLPLHVGEHELDQLAVFPLGLVAK